MGGGIALALLGGLAGALVGGAVWAGVVVGTGYEVGWVAWGVGVLTGLGTVAVGREQSDSVGILAAVLALGGLLFAKTLMMCGDHSAVTDEIAKDPLMSMSAVANDMMTDGRTDPQLVLRLNAAPPDQRLPDDLQAEYDAALDAHLARMTEEDRQQANAALASVVLDKMGRSERFFAQLSGWDALWFLLAVVSAYKVGTGGSAED